MLTQSHEYGLPKIDRAYTPPWQFHTVPGWGKILYVTFLIEDSKSVLAMTGFVSHLMALTTMLSWGSGKFYSKW